IPVIIPEHSAIRAREDAATLTAFATTQTAKI
nr:hypothetical protein [Tanacetum cinerariifolium]